MVRRQRLFVSYSQKDRRWLELLLQHLAVLEREGLVEVFADTRLAAGEDWYARLHEEMLWAKVGLLLVSADFLTSAFIREEEVPTLFATHERDGMTIYPLLIRPCPWRHVKWLTRLQMRPPGVRPISALRGAAKEQALADVANEIAGLVHSP